MGGSGEEGATRAALPPPQPQQPDPKAFSSIKAERRRAGDRAFRAVRDFDRNVKPELPAGLLVAQQKALDLIASLPAALPPGTLPPSFQKGPAARKGHCRRY